MNALTPANQLTLLRMLLIPAFVILVVYGQLGWALIVFATAGVTDSLDGLLARRWGPTSIGAWLDPMADKLLLVTMFVVLTLPGIGSANQLPVWFTILVISRDIAIVATVAVVNLAIGRRTFRPSIFGKIATATYILTVDKGKEAKDDDFFSQSQRAKERGWTMLQLTSDHNPQWSAPEALAEMLAGVH